MIETADPAPPRTLAPHRRGTPSRLLTSAAWLVFPVVAFLGVFEWRFAAIQPSHYAAKRDLLEQRLANTEILILGSSHAYMGIDAASCSRPAFNLANNSQSLFYDVALLHRYRPRLNSLRQVIFTISYFTMGTELDETSDRWRSYYYKYFFSLPHRDWHMAISARNYSAWFLCGSEISRTSVLFGTARSAVSEYDAYGDWTNRPVPLQSPDEWERSLKSTAETVAKRHNSYIRPENWARNVERLETAIEELKRSGVDVLLVTLPATRYYRERIDPVKYQNMQEELRRIAAVHRVTYTNFLANDQFTSADFHDGDHLNLAGARKLTRLLPSRKSEEMARQATSGSAGSAASGP